MLADEQNIPRYVAASDGPGRMLEVAESETGQVPCTEAFVNDAVVASTDVTAESRWPDLATALRPHGVRAVLGLRYVSVRLPSELLTSSMTGRTFGRTTSARRWAAIATLSNPLSPPPWPPKMPASWPPSCSTHWTIE